MSRYSKYLFHSYPLHENSNNHINLTIDDQSYSLPIKIHPSNMGKYIGTLGLQANMIVKKIETNKSLLNNTLNKLKEYIENDDMYREVNGNQKVSNIKDYVRPCWIIYDFSYQYNKGVVVSLIFEYKHSITSKFDPEHPGIALLFNQSGLINIGNELEFY